MMEIWDISITKMKVLYSQIKELIPNIKATPKEIAHTLTLIGFMIDSFEEVQYRGKRDYLMNCEVRQNRGDCLSIIGLAKEVAAYYGLKIKLSDIFFSTTSKVKKNLDIKVEANSYVKRILAVKIEKLKNKKSPDWLKEFLAFYEINSLNFLVDLSNYVMLFTGYPSHLLDMEKIDNQLIWSLNDNFNKITTLDGSDIKLDKKELIIRDDKKILALAGVIGGKISAVDLNTKSIIAEIAIYDHAIIRKNSRDLNIITEASNRLSKILDPNGIEFAMNLLISMILKNCGGSVSGNFDYYPKKYIQSEIELDLTNVSPYAGVEISAKKSVEILKNLNFKIYPVKLPKGTFVGNKRFNGVKNFNDKLMITPPINRTDISTQEELIEEIVRIYGYDKIPYNELPRLETVGNITSKNVYLKEKIRDILSILGFDEILSLVLIKKDSNFLTNYLSWDIISTQNSINEDYTELRQSMVNGLINQTQKYLKKNIEYIKIFEIGKIFGKRGNNYEERDVVGILIHTFKEKKILAIKEITEKLLRLIGIVDISYIKSKNRPQIANYYSCWDVVVKEKIIGIIYKIRPQELNQDQNIYFAEFNIDKIVNLLEGIQNESRDDQNGQNRSAVELIQKLIILDANVEIKKGESISNFLNKIKKRVPRKNIWSLNIVDKFSLEDKNRYTIRVSYKDLSDQEAKKIHLKIFNL